MRLLRFIADRPVPSNPYGMQTVRDDELVELLTELALRPQSEVPADVLSGMTDYVLHLRDIGYSAEHIREKVMWHLEQRQKGCIMADDSREPTPQEQKPESDFVTKACDMGAHERCHLGAREMRPCECWCHKQRVPRR